MLSYKASATTNHTHSRDDSSDWEVLSGDNYDGDSEASSISYFSEDDDDFPPMISSSKITGQHPQRNGVVGVANLHDDVEVDYHTPKRFSRTLEVETEEKEDRGSMGKRVESNKGVLQEGVGMDGDDGGHPISPKISIMQAGKVEWLRSPLR